MKTYLKYHKGIQIHVVTQIQRFSQIVEILGKYGFGILLSKVFPDHSRAGYPFNDVSREPPVMYEQMRLAIEELGPAFVKFGQILSTRADLLPTGMIEELKKLQDRVKPVPFLEVRPVIEECCPHPDGLFREIDETPVASASVAQVHRAVLRDGTPVALKIQRPGIGDVIGTDLRILQTMAERVEGVFPDAAIYNPTGMVKDFARQIQNELDFSREARAAERMRQNFRDVPGIRIPKIFWEYSSPRLLVMEFVEGVRIDNPEAISAMGLDPHEIVVRGFQAYLKMIFEDGFFHGDPHPGNLLVTKDGTIVVMDFGITGTVRPEKRRNFTSFLFALMNEDTGLMIKSLEGFGVVIPDENREPLQDDLFVLMQDLAFGYTISQFHFAFFVTELSAIMRHYRMKVPVNLLLLLKVLVMILDIGVRLDPAFNVRDELSPYLTRIARKHTFSVTSAKRISVSLQETLDAMIDMPRYLNLMLRRYSTGTLGLDFVDRDLQDFEVALDSAGDKLMIGLVVGSLVVGSSLVLRAAPLPIPSEVLLLAVFGYAAAVLVGFYAVYHGIFLKLRLDR